MALFIPMARTGGDTTIPPQGEELKINLKPKAEFDLVGIVKAKITNEALSYGLDPILPLAIVKCEGGFESPEQCNARYGCIAGQGHFQFIPSTWRNIIEFKNTPLPEYCREREAVFISECNIIAGVWLLNQDGDRHWREWSGACYLPLTKS